MTQLGLFPSASKPRRKRREPPWRDRKVIDAICAIHVDPTAHHRGAAACTAEHHRLLTALMDRAATFNGFNLRDKLLFELWVASNETGYPHDHDKP